MPELRGDLVPSKAEEFNTIAKTIFAPIYPAIAEKMLGWAVLDEGICLDLGAGPGLLGIAVADKCACNVISLDSDPETGPQALKNAEAAGLSGRVIPVTADVHALPFRENSVALVVSRGSYIFWNDHPRAFAEIERVLLPGGMACVGGGFGSAALKKKVFAAMRAYDPEWDSGVSRRQSKVRPEDLRAGLEKSGVQSYRILSDESGLWVIIRKDPEISVNPGF